MAGASQDWLARHAARLPDKAALHIVGGETLSYAALDAWAERLADWFAGQGLAGGDTIALLMDNSAATIATWWGARRAGLYYVPLGAKLRANEIAYIVEDSGARMLLASPDLAALAEAARALVPDPALRLHVPDGSENGPPRSPAEVTGREIIYSSGTTGRPKGIRRALASAADAYAIPAFEQKLRAAIGFAEDMVYLSVSPLYHATGRYPMRIVETGGTAVILPAFDPAEALAAIARYRVTHSQWVPTMFTRLLALPEAERCAHDLSSHRVALHAAAPCPVPVKRAMIDWWGPILSEYYGGSENAGVTFITTPEWLERPGSVGRSITGAIHILDEEDGRELPPGAIGLIHFEGGVPFRYIGQEGDRNAGGLAGYGDLGHVDAEGYLFISDRRSDLIIRGGVNVYPREVEAVLETHPAVAEVAVIGLPDAEYGQSVKAVVCPAGPADPDLADALIAFCRQRLASIKCPASVDFIDALPRNDNGKLLKRALRDAYVAPVS